MIYEATEEHIAAAARLIRRGGIAALPTETVYGLGANAFDAQAVRRIFELKGRPSFNPLIVHLHSLDQVPSVADLEHNPHAAELLEKLAKFWPGPLSLVVPKKPAVPDEVTAGLDTVAIRIPSHPVARAVLKSSGCPIAAPSANRFTEVSPTRAAHVEESLGPDLFVLDGGPCAVGLESTVLSIAQDPAELLRPGAVTLESLEAAIGPIKKVLHESAAPRSPGMLRRHYAPRTPIAFRESLPAALPEKVGFISFGGRNAEFRCSKQEQLSPKGDLGEVAARLFDAIHALDKEDLDLIVVDTCEERGLGLAIMDRLRRAAEEKTQGE